MQPFSTITSVNDVEGYFRIQWNLNPLFQDRGPYVYQLQVAPTSLPESDLWEDVGSPAEEAAFLIDDTKRDYGKSFEHHYRIVLSSADGEYTSPSFNAESTDLGFRDRRLIREMIRQFTKRVSRFTGVKGRVMKRKRYGPKCTNCIDPFTGETTNPQCTVCFGVGIQGGYHRPSCELFAEMSLVRSRVQVEDGGNLQTIEPIQNRLLVMGFPLVSSEDVWIESRTGKRWFCKDIAKVAALRGYDYGVTIDINLAPFSDLIYQVHREQA